MVLGCDFGFGEGWVGLPGCRVGLLIWEGCTHVRTRARHEQGQILSTSHFQIKKIQIKNIVCV